MVSCIITYNSKKVVTVTKKDESEYYVRYFVLGGSYDNTFEEKIGGEVEYGQQEHYIKLKEVEQNGNGTKFAFVYFDDGRFYLRTLADTDRLENRKRLPQDIASNELDINTELDLDDRTMSIDNFDDPFITCTFIDDVHIYVNLFHAASFTTHHFVYN